jgi:hypothetical protein
MNNASKLCQRHIPDLANRAAGSEYGFSQKQHFAFFTQHIMRRGGWRCAGATAAQPLLGTTLRPSEPRLGFSFVHLRPHAGLRQVLLSTCHENKADFAFYLGTLQ